MASCTSRENVNIAENCSSITSSSPIFAHFLVKTVDIQVSLIPTKSLLYLYVRVNGKSCIFPPDLNLLQCDVLNESNLRYTIIVGACYPF